MREEIFSASSYPKTISKLAILVYPFLSILHCKYSIKKGIRQSFLVVFDTRMRRICGKTFSNKRKYFQFRTTKKQPDDSGRFSGNDYPIRYGALTLALSACLFNIPRIYKIHLTSCTFLIIQFLNFINCKFCSQCNLLISQLSNQK